MPELGEGFRLARWAEHLLSDAHSWDGEPFTHGRWGRLFLSRLTQAGASPEQLDLPAESLDPFFVAVGRGLKDAIRRTDLPLDMRSEAMFAIPKLFEWFGPAALSEMTVRFFWANTLRPFYELSEIDAGALESAALSVLAYQLQSKHEMVRIGALEGLTSIDSRASLEVVASVWERLNATERAYLGRWPR